MLKKSNITLDLKNASPEERSGQAKAMAAANKEFQGNVDATIENKGIIYIGWHRSIIQYYS